MSDMEKKIENVVEMAQTADDAGEEIVSEVEEVEENETISDITDSKLTPEEQIEFLKRKLEQAEMEATDNRIALIEMTAGRNALYKSLQETQMRLAEAVGQRENDVEAYQKELDARLDEKRKLQEQYDSIVIKAKRYEEKALDTIMLIDSIEKEIKLFREDLTYLRRDIRIGTFTLDDRLDNVYMRLCRNLDKLLVIKEDFCRKNSLPLDDDEFLNEDGKAPTLSYPDENGDLPDVKE